MERITIETLAVEQLVPVALSKFEQLVTEAAELKTAIKLLPYIPSYEQKDALDSLFGKTPPAENADEDEAETINPTEARAGGDA